MKENQPKTFAKRTFVLPKGASSTSTTTSSSAKTSEASTSTTYSLFSARVLASKNEPKSVPKFTLGGTLPAKPTKETHKAVAVATTTKKKEEQPLKKMFALKPPKKDEVRKVDCGVIFVSFVDV